jgi:hypothetical protein
MAGLMRDWRDIHVPLVLPINGKQYKIPPVSVETGALIRLAQSDDEEAARVATEQLNDGFNERILGDTYAEMLADGVPDVAVVRAATTALVDHNHGRVAAVAMWETGALDPEALAAFMAATKAITEIH